MDINDLIAMVTEGLPADQAAVVKAAIERDTVKTKASGLKQQSEYATLQTQAQTLQAELDGDAASGKLGARAYREWYADNAVAIRKLQADMTKYQEKYGALDNPNPANPNPNPNPSSLTAADIQREVDKRIQENYGPTWSTLLKGTQKITMKHILAGRKSEIDIDKISELAASKYNGNLETAYDEWDKPERDKVEAASKESEIQRRVTEELQKRNATQQFPAGADSTPGALASRTKAEVDGFDRNAMLRDLTQTFVTGEPPKSVQ